LIAEPAAFSTAYRQKGAPGSGGCGPVPDRFEIRCRTVNRHRIMKRGLTLLLGAALALAATRPALATDARELKAREAFVAGRYQEALDAFVKLYAESLHPNYLRNIGRCYQGLAEPERAITSFRDYLHKAKGISAEERSEVEGFIREMDELKQQRAAAAAPAPVVTPLPSASATGTVPPAAAAEPAAPTTAVTLARTQEPAAAESSPFYTRWWFWTAVGATIGASIAIAAAAGAFSRTEDASCPTGRTCSN
jgi:tetratricopeptide (TPR) repeat protein